MKRLAAAIFVAAFSTFALAPLAAHANDCVNYPPGTPQCPTNHTSSLSSGTVAAGGSVTFQGCCFDGGSTVRVSAASTPRFLGSTTAYNSEFFSITVTIPSDFSAGQHTLFADGTLGGSPNEVTAAFTVTRGGLTPTGSNTLPFVIIGLGVVAVGGTLVGVSRRKSQ